MGGGYRGQFKQGTIDVLPKELQALREGAALPGSNILNISNRSSVKWSLPTSNLKTTI